MTLDPHFGAATGKETMFELRLSVIQMETREIARSADLLWFLSSPSTQLARYDMGESIKRLRDAADRLEQVLGRQAMAEAAE